MKRSASLILGSTLTLLLAVPAHASFHVMQVEQLIGGVSGNNTYQAIQLRMRTGFQNQMQLSRINVRDAAGNNPILLVDMTAPVANSATGSRVLIMSSTMAANQGPPPDFTMTNLIPASYLAAGSLTFEDDFGTIYWRVSWGGAGYTGPGTGSTTNDLDGNFNPPFAGALPNAGVEALRFPGAADAGSTNNASDYSVTVGGATLTNNAGTSAAVLPVVSVEGPIPVRIALGRPTPNPSSGGVNYAISLPHESKVRVQVIDLAGRVVRTLIDGTMPAGTSNHSWDAAVSGTRVSSGVYVLRLEAGGETQSKRFALTR
jgi:hypothetical protein